MGLFKIKKINKFEKYFTIITNEINDNNIYELQLYNLIFNIFYVNNYFFNSFYNINIINIFIEIILKKEDDYLKIFNIIIKCNFGKYNDNEYVIHLGKYYFYETEITDTNKLLYLINYFIINYKIKILYKLKIDFKLILNKILKKIDSNNKLELNISLYRFVMLLNFLKNEINDTLFKYDYYLRFTWIGKIMSLSILK